MSTKFILNEGKDSVEQIILDALNPLMRAVVLQLNPIYRGKKNAALLQSAVDTLAIPVTAQIIETLSGNADGATDVMRSVRNDEHERHGKLMASAEKQSLHDLIDAIFDEPAKGTATAEGAERDAEKLVDRMLEEVFGIKKRAA